MKRLKRYIYETLKSLELYGYISVSVFMYSYIFLFLSALVYIFNYDELAAYLVTYSSAYLVDYLLTLKFVFRETHFWKKSIKYILYILLFLGLNTAVYALLLDHFSFLISALLTATLLMPFKFLLSKHWVYR
ncbi:MAG: GtrA family protein [Arenicellales bacterium]